MLLRKQGANAVDVTAWTTRRREHLRCNNGRKIEKCLELVRIVEGAQELLKNAQDMKNDGQYAQNRAAMEQIVHLIRKSGKIVKGGLYCCAHVWFWTKKKSSFITGLMGKINPQ